MFLLMTCLFFSALSPFTVMLEFVQQHLRCDTAPRCRRTFGVFLQTLPFNFIGCYLCLGIKSPDFLADDDVRILA